MTDESGQETYRFDVAFSFAGSERELAKRLAKIVRESGFEVFYDQFEPHKLWGENLPARFDEIHRKLSRYCVIFVSRNYLDRVWTNRELRSAISRSLQERGRAYILPIQVDDAELPGLHETTGYLSLKLFPLEQIADNLIKKLEEDKSPQEVSYLLADSVNNQASLRTLVSIYRKHPNDYQLFHSTIPQWSDELIQSMINTTPNALASIVSQIDRHLPAHFPFRYLDTLANWLGRLYRLSNNNRVSGEALKGLLRLGLEYDEMDMGREFARIAAQADSPRSIESIVDALLEQPDATEWVGNYLEQSGAANKVSVALKQRGLNQSEDRDISETQLEN